MSADEYVPSEAEMMIAWHRHATAEDAKHGRLRDDSESTTKEFVRYMAHVRRDAGREALNRLIEHAELLAERAGEHYTARCIWQTVAGFAEGSRDTHYPEEKK